MKNASGIEPAASQLNVCVHSSQFPDQVAMALRQALRTRRIPPKFHYQSFKQARLWLTLHEAYAPCRTQPDGMGTYERAWPSLAGSLPPSGKIHLVGLGCGGGQKEASLAASLQGQGHPVSFLPVDASLPLVLTAWAKLQPWLDPSGAPRSASLQPPAGLVCDLDAAPDLAQVLAQLSPEGVPRVLTFFGMLPNFDPVLALPWLSRLLGPADRLLLSANLLPGPDEETGLQRVLPQYQNLMTERWLALFLSDLGLNPGDGVMAWRIEGDPKLHDLKCITAWYQFERTWRIEVDDEEFCFQPGDKLRLFFSYRYSADRLHTLLWQYQLDVLDSWVTTSGEEAVFLCRRAEPTSL